MATTTTGWHRVGNVTSRATTGIQQNIVPGASIAVTSTATGTAAVIYSDPEMSIQITGGLLTADTLGNYDYYLPLNYCVTETITSPDGGQSVTQNIVQNGPLVETLTTTNASSDTVNVTGTLSTSHVAICPTNASAAAMTGVYVTKAAGSITVYHPTTAGATFDLLITPY